MRIVLAADHAGYLLKNVLCLGARVIGGSLAIDIVTAFLGASFTGEERHQRRLKKVLDIESRYSKE